ncbi:hypothetical protein [Flavobacterium sp.]|uniref:hypothetical protein n=1 Tax=Flavobacterium sp. TaxID=239 RepID=UPI003263E74E
MKRWFAFLLFMNFLLVSGGQYIHAKTNHTASFHNIERKHHIKYTSQDQTTSIIEEADVEEDYSGNNDVKGLPGVKSFSSRYSLLNQWYLTFPRQIITDSYNYFEIFGSSYGQSNPIYITQRVLRI